MTDVLVEHERIETTWSKAKALRSWAEPLVSWSKRIKFKLTNEHGLCFYPFHSCAVIENSHKTR